MLQLKVAAIVVAGLIVTAAPAAAGLVSPACNMAAVELSIH
jgi:hypothetical protein